MSTLFLLIPDVALREAVAEQVTAAGLGVPRVAESMQSLLKAAENETVDAIIIDEVAFDKRPAALAALAQKQKGPAILLLGGEDEAEAASETFVKPFRLGHLLARLRYYLETAPLLRDRPVRFGPWRLEPQNRRISWENSADSIRLTEKETALLVFLAHCSEPATRGDILAGVWGYDERIDTHTLETHVYQLRRKLDQGNEGQSEGWILFEAGAYRLAGARE